MSAIPARNARAASKVTTEMMLVTPTLAAKWLHENNKNNRAISKAHVDRLADDMEAGRFLVTHQGIAFNCDGTLLDGQHRLAAIIQSGISQNLLVSTGLPKESTAGIDDHRKRTVSHSLQVVHGVSVPNMARAVAAAGWIRRGVGVYDVVSRRELESNFLKHADALAWAIEKFPNSKKGLGRAQVLAVIARAYYTEPRTKLAHACEVLADSSLANKDDGWLLRLRDFLMTGSSTGGVDRRRGTSNHQGEAMEIYKKTQTALRRHLDGVPCTATSRLLVVSEDLFPLPEAYR